MAKSPVNGFLIAGIVVSVGILLFHNLTSSQTLHVVCSGATVETYNKNRIYSDKAIYGLEITSYDTLLGKGALISSALYSGLNDQYLGKMNTAFGEILYDKTDKLKMINFGFITEISSNENYSKYESIEIRYDRIAQFVYFEESKDQKERIISFGGPCRTIKYDDR